MRIRYTLLIALILIGISVQAQLHLGKSKDELITVLGTNNVRVYDENGSEVIAYVNEIQNHPKFGNYTLYSLYIFENNLCIMQQTIMPVSQKTELTAGFNSLYQKMDDMVWKSKDGIYYVLSFDKENLRMNVMTDSIYNRKQN